MQSRDSGGSPVPWAAVIAVLFAASGAVFYFSPLTSSRPPMPAVADVDALGYQDAAARLWQDPFKAVADRREAIAKEHSGGPGSGLTVGISAGPGGSATAQLLLGGQEHEHDVHRLSDLGEQTRLHWGNKPVLVLPVLVPASVYGALTEHRLRVRVAVLEGVAACGYQPSDNDHIGYVEIGWLWKPYRGAVDGAKSAVDNEIGDAHGHPLVLPYEWCEPATVPMPSPITTGTPLPPPYAAVLVLWLSEEHFLDVPLSRLAALIDAIRGAAVAGHHPAPRLIFHVIGPDASTTLRAMLDEAGRLPRAPSSRPSASDSGSPAHDVRVALTGVTMYDATATADDRLLLSDLAPSNSLPNNISSWIGSHLKSEEGPGFELQRTTLTDRGLAAALAKELERRQLKVRSKGKASAMDHVAIVTEWDTFYGRALPYSFGWALRYGDPGVLNRAKPLPEWLHTFVYLRGIDGKVPGGDSATGAESTASEKAADKWKSSSGSALKFGAPGESPEGLNQADYLRRLAEQLANLDEALRRKGKELKAVGILGTDMYDKLLILRALRDRLHGPIFFTTGLDAHYELPSEWPWTHNLVIASAFGLRLHRYYQQSVPPFRDSDQTAVFHATLCAVNPSVSAATESASVPRLFEIGRSGPYDLTVDNTMPGYIWPDGAASEMLGPGAKLRQGVLHPPRYDLAVWPAGWHGWWPWIAVALLLAALLGLPIAMGVRPPTFHPSKLITMTPAFLAWSVPALAFIIFVLVHLDEMEGSPFALFDRISPWPTEAVRLFAALLCVHLIIKARSDARRSNTEIQKDFDLKGLAAWQVGMKGNHYEPLESTRTLIRLNDWNVTDPNAAPSESRVYAQNLWWAYLRRNGWWARVVRVGAMSAAFFLLGLCIRHLFVPPPNPTRGAMAHLMDRMASVWLSVPLFIILTFYVLDGAYLNKRFIEYLTEPQTHYPPEAFSQFKHLGLPEADLKEYADIRLIARRTKVAGAAIYYPFVIFFLVVAARNPLFADWKWPVALLILLGMMLALASGGALLLRVAAEKARRQALERVERRLLERRVQPGKEKEARSLAHIVRLIKDERTGAFSVLSQHPYAAALILPSGSIGLWALVEYLPRAIS